MLVTSKGFPAPERLRRAPPAAPPAEPLLAGAAPGRPPLLGRAQPRRRPHRRLRRAPRQDAVGARHLPGVRAAQPGHVRGRGQLRDPHGPRHAGEAVRDGGRHGVLPHLAAVLPLQGLLPPPVRPGLQPQDVEHLRLRLLRRVAVQRPLHRHAQPGRLLLLQRLHLPGQLRRQLLLRRLPQQGHRLLRLQHRAQLLLRLRPGQRGPLRPLRRAHGPGPQQALAPLPARADARLLLLLLPPVLLLLRLPLHRLLQPGHVLLHADGVQLARRLALLHQALRDDGRREVAGRLVVGVLQPADHHRLRHGHHAPAHGRLLRAQQVGGRGHEGRGAGVGVLHPRHLLPGPGGAAARAGGHHGVRGRRGAQAVRAEPARRRRQLHDMPRLRARTERRHHREHAAADLQRRVRRQEQQHRLRRRRLQLRRRAYACTERVKCPTLGKLIGIALFAIHIRPVRPHIILWKLRIHRSHDQKVEVDKVLL